MQALDPLELAAVVLSIAAVWWTTARKPICWPVGLVSVLVYAWIFFRARLYSDALLQGVYAVLQVYGWRRWSAAPQEQGLPQLRRPALSELLLHLSIGAVGAVLLGTAMARYTDAAVPWLDATLTAFSLVAQWWAARLVRTNWLLWIAVDVVYVGLYATRQLPLTAALYAGFVVLAAIGWWRWGRTLGEASPLPQ